jgi:broad specificity phosphatase PhoE
MINTLNFELFLIRHGESEVNVQPDLMGQTSNVLLTEKGKHQATLLGEYFKKKDIFFDEVFSSTYIRAKDTAEISMGVLGIDKSVIVLTDCLREYSAGEWTGASRKVTLTPEVTYKMMALGQTFQPPGGESMHQVERRASGWLEDTLIYNKDFQNRCKNRPHKTKVAVFSHGLTIKCLMHYIMGFDQIMTWRVNIDNTSISRFVFKDAWFVQSINERPHLD